MPPDWRANNHQERGASPSEDQRGGYFVFRVSDSHSGMTALEKTSCEGFFNIARAKDSDSHIFMFLPSGIRTGPAYNLCLIVSGRNSPA
jgi:hypothetical protein